MGIDEEAFIQKEKIVFSDARRAVLELIEGKIVVGHAVWNDFEALQITHPWHMVRDIALYMSLRPPWRQHKLPSLRLLAQHWLARDIHRGYHDSTIDATVALRLYKMHQRSFETVFGNALIMSRPAANGASHRSVGVCVVPNSLLFSGRSSIRELCNFYVL